MFESNKRKKKKAEYFSVKQFRKKEVGWKWNRGILDVYKNEKEKRRKGAKYFWGYTYLAKASRQGHRCAARIVIYVVVPGYMGSGVYHCCHHNGTKCNTRTLSGALSHNVS